MEGLQRSTTSFRRQGSSGLIWDDKVLSGDLSHFKSKKIEDKEKVELTRSQSAGSTSVMQRSQSNGGGGRAYRAVKVSPPSVDPPSPKASGCGLCGIFGRPDQRAHHQKKSNKRKL